MSRPLHETLPAHKVRTVVAILAVITFVQFLFPGIGFGSGDSGLDPGPIGTTP